MSLPQEDRDAEPAHVIPHNKDAEIATSSASVDSTEAEAKSETAIAHDPSGVFPFFCLPRELRDQIYKELFKGFVYLGVDIWFSREMEDVTEYKSDSLVTGPYKFRQRGGPHPVNTLLASKRIYNEACPMLYGKLKFKTWECAYDFLQHRPTGSPHIKELRIETFEVPHYWSACFRMFDFFELLSNLQLRSIEKGAGTMLPQLQYGKLSARNKYNEAWQSWRCPAAGKDLFRKLAGKAHGRWAVYPAIFGMSRYRAYEDDDDDYSESGCGPECTDCRSGYGDNNSDYVNVYGNHINKE